MVSRLSKDCCGADRQCYARCSDQACEGEREVLWRLQPRRAHKQGETTYVPVRCFGKLIEELTAMKKGTKVFIKGELEIATFASEEGGKRMTFRVLANTYRLLGNERRADARQVVAEHEQEKAKPRDATRGCRREG